MTASPTSQIGLKDHCLVAQMRVSWPPLMVAQDKVHVHEARFSK